MSYFESVPLDEVRSLVRDDEALPPVLLVVDDEHVIADTLGIILADSGFSTFVAYDADSAIEIAKLVPPDMVITDVVMPGKNGIELAASLREQFPNVRIMLFSGQATTADLSDAAQKAGEPFGIVAKPIHPAELLTMLRSSLALPA